MSRMCINAPAPKKTVAHRGGLSFLKAVIPDNRNAYYKNRQRRIGLNIAEEILDWSYENHQCSA